MYREFIGSLLKIINSKNISLIGKQGKIIDETQNLIIIEENNKKITKILKKGSVFDIAGTKIIGDKIQKRPEDRIKLIKKI